MKRRTFVISSISGGVVLLGGAIAGLPAARRKLYYSLSRIEVDPQKGTPSDSVISSMSALAGTLTGDFDWDALGEAMRPWLVYHAENHAGWLDKYTTSADYLDQLAFRYGKRAFQAFSPKQAVEHISGVLGQTDSTRQLLSPMARERWYLKQTVCDHLRLGWSRSRRPWDVVGYGELVPGSFPGARAYTQPPALTPVE